MVKRQGLLQPALQANTVRTITTRPELTAALMEVPLMAPSPRAPAPSPRPRSPGMPAADPHSVQLSRYDGRLLLDRAVVPDDNGFADADAETGMQERSPRRLNHYLVALTFFVATFTYAAALMVLAFHYDWRSHRGKWSAAVSAQVTICFEIACHVQR